MKIKKVFVSLERKLKTSGKLLTVAFLSGALMYIQNAHHNQISKETAQKMQELNLRYGFNYGEDLLNDESHSPILASLLSNNVLTSTGKSNNQGIIVHIEKEGDTSLILMTPKSEIDEERLWDIAENYESIDEVTYAEPDVVLTTYSSTTVEEYETYKEVTKITDTLSSIVSPHIQLFSVDEGQVVANAVRARILERNKWWEKKEENIPLRARLTFPKTASYFTIGVLDSGIDDRHERLESRVWVNERETEGNLKDDDSNGYLDDRHGFDFTKSKGDTIKDTIGHGTHVSGIIAKHSNHPIAALKVFDREAESRLSYAVKAIKYAADNNMRVLNVSFGTTADLRTFREIVDYADARGTIIIAASGNNGSTKEHYPAAYEKVIAVSATGADGDRLKESNYGDWVDVYAPGERILSTIPSNENNNNRYGYLSGTSQAAPFVTAVVSNMLYDEPNMTVDDVREKIKDYDFSVMTGPHPNDVFERDTQ